MEKYVLILVSYILSFTILRNGVLLYAQPTQSFNVMNFGAVGDGIKDDSQAFTRAWEAICKVKTQRVILQIPKEKTFLVKPLKFVGPCNSPNINIQVLGKIVAPNAPSDYPKPTAKTLLLFTKVDGLTLNGGGTIDGRGLNWWKSCVGHILTCGGRPSTAAFIHCNNLSIHSLKFMDSPANHISIDNCNGVVISQLVIYAPPDSFNTDGIDIAYSTGVAIRKCVIATGDDCIAITNESRNINITKVYCGPGHGISIGSLGKGGSYDFVEDVHVWNCTFKDTQNGARIKTWQGGSGYVRNIIYEDIIFKNAGNPIFVDQYYCPPQHCANQTSAVKISDVSFKRVKGTSSTYSAIKLHCSESFGCKNIDIEQADIISSTPGVKTITDCFNADVRTTLSENTPSVHTCLHK